MILGVRFIWPQLKNAKITHGKVDNNVLIVRQI